MPKMMPKMAHKRAPECAKKGAKNIRSTRNQNLDLRQRLKCHDQLPAGMSHDHADRDSRRRSAPAVSAGGA